MESSSTQAGDFGPTRQCTVSFRESRRHVREQAPTSIYIFLRVGDGGKEGNQIARTGPSFVRVQWNVDQ